jgi:hypothetical protein
MPFFVVSYRHEYTQYCTRSCNCVEDHADADLQLGTFQTEEEVADFLARRIHEKPEARFTNFVADRWEDVLAQGRSSWLPDLKGEDSVFFAWSDPDDYAGDEEEFARESERKTKAESRLRTLVKAKTQALSEAALAARLNREAQERQRKEQEAAANRKAAYERLKKEFGE